ncbi:MAG: response regulator receiver protein [bacterium P3]|nr:MAG: response regulator receiver protein [bacterium P3]KWW42720.1 MAG: response regulator receiver protein [bacterium F083]
MSLIDRLRQPVPEFLGRRRNTVYFILFVLVFAVFFILVYHPIGFHNTVSTLPRWSEEAYTAVTVGVGFITLVVSRIVLLRLLRRGKMTLGGYLLWIIGEFLFFSVSLTLLAYLINGQYEISFMRLWIRIFFSITCILSVPYLLFALSMLLHERNRQIERLNLLVAQQQEVEPVSETINFYDKGGRLAFALRRSQVLYVESMDNYTNIHYLSDDNRVESFILHNSMKQLEQLYERWGLLRCHRSYMVNIDNVKLLRRERDGFVVELAFGDKSIPISKSYSDRIVHQFTTLNG